MTVSAYQIDNVIKAYNKQSKGKVRLDAPQASTQDKYVDIVSLSGGADFKADAYKKISYSLLDVITKDKK